MMTEVELEEALNVISRNVADSRAFNERTMAAAERAAKALERIAVALEPMHVGFDSSLEWPEEDD